MPRYVALLRAINVGGHVVKMDRLRGLFEELKFTRVESFIASGNVIFDTRSTDSAALETRIEKRLKEALGYEVATFLRTPEELKTIAAYAPFAEDTVGQDASLYVVFIKTAPHEEARAKVLSFCTATDQFHTHGREIYWRRIRVGDAAFTGPPLERALKAPTTFRNVTTVRKLAAKCAP